MGTSNNKKPWSQGRQGHVLEQTESPLAFFSVVAISRAPKRPKSFHVGFSLSRPVPEINGTSTHAANGARPSPRIYKYVRLVPDLPTAPSQ